LGETLSEVPEELKYTKEHEWIRVEGSEVVIGITDFAQNALTDVVWVELPEDGATVSSMESFASVESVKSVSEIYAPVGGEVVGVNEDLEGAPELINDDPYGDGWICRISISDPSELDTLLDSVSYSELIAE
jgi:glycine cleavage system H protein|tara:strand:- start:1805 stop:2200 length:396 start_codon:yes stop_codon:yes gene_type:complete